MQFRVDEPDACFWMFEVPEEYDVAEFALRQRQAANDADGTAGGHVPPRAQLVEQFLRLACQSCRERLLVGRRQLSVPLLRSVAPIRA